MLAKTLPKSLSGGKLVKILEVAELLEAVISLKNNFPSIFVLIIFCKLENKVHTTYLQLVFDKLSISKNGYFLNVTDNLAVRAAL